MTQSKKFEMQIHTIRHGAEAFRSGFHFSICYLVMNFLACFFSIADGDGDVPFLIDAMIDGGFALVACHFVHRLFKAVADVLEEQRATV